MDVTHIDTCLGCYLQDHHDRPGELLLGVIVDGSTTYQEVKDLLLQELNGLSLDPSEFDYDAAEAAIRSEFETVSDMSKPFDPSLDVASMEPGPDEDRFENEFSDYCQAWFLFEFEADSDVA